MGVITHEITAYPSLEYIIYLHGNDGVEMEEKDRQEPRFTVRLAHRKHVWELL